MIPARDIEQIIHAVRARLHLSGSGTGGGGTSIGPHTHSADAIAFTSAGAITADDVQEGMEELDTEKLARDGSQTMLGALDMNHNSIANADDLEVEGTATVRENVALTGGAGLAAVTGARRIEFVTTVVPGTDYAAGEGIVSWSATERAFVVTMRSGA